MSFTRGIPIPWLSLECHVYGWELNIRHGSFIQASRATLGSNSWTRIPSRGVLESMDKSSEGVQKYLDAAQLISDLLSTYGGKDGSLREAPSKSEIISALKAKVIPDLIRPREGHELDSPSDNETAYGGPSGDQIRDIDLAIRAAVHQNAIPIGYEPPSDRSFDVWYTQQCSAAAINHASAVSAALNCDKRNQKPSSHTSWLGDIWGDTHILTLDGRSYDFQAVGEFVALKATLDSFEVQVRQSPYGSSRTASIITAVASNVAGDRVGIYLGNEPTVRINGNIAVFPSDVISLPHGGKVEKGQNQFFIQWPDSTALRIEMNGGYLNIFVDPPDARRSRLRGLFGNFDNHAENDLMSRDGSIVRATTGKPFSDALYGSFGKSWRINQAESLFDYPPGKSTRNFTDLTFPDMPVAAGDLIGAKRRMAETKCRAAGLTQEPFFTACVIDLCVTGDVSFARGFRPAVHFTACVDEGFEPRHARPHWLKRDFGAMERGEHRVDGCRRFNAKVKIDAVLLRWWRNLSAVASSR